MDPGDRLRRFSSLNAGRCLIACAAFFCAAAATRPAFAGCQCGKAWPHLRCAHHQVAGHTPGPGDVGDIESGGTWYWLRSPEQERRVVMNLYNRYCIRCHGVDGRGVWDIPDVPDFTNTVWQATRPDSYRSRVILEGRGAVMPAFRGTLTLEESCAMARYLHTFVPGTEVSRPGLGPTVGESPPAVTPPAALPAAAAPPTPPAPNTSGPFAR